MAPLRPSEPAQRKSGVEIIIPSVSILAEPHKFNLSTVLHRQSPSFPSLMVASSNDPWMKLMNAAYWVNRWANELVNLGDVGHINPEFGFGPLVEGLQLFCAFHRHHHDWIG